MRNHAADRELGASAGERSGGHAVRPRLSRRQALGRMSAVATVGAAAWVVPEILTAKPASGASLSGGVGHTGTGASVGVSTSAGTTGDGPTTGASVSGSGAATVDSAAGTGASTGAPTSAKSLAFTGLDIKRDAEVGVSLIAGGWAMHHWSSRTPKPALAVDAEAEAGAGNTGTVD